MFTNDFSSFLDSDPFILCNTLICLLLQSLFQSLFCLIKVLTTSAFFPFPFAWHIHSFTFSLCVSLHLKWVFHKWHTEGSCLFIRAATLCLLIREFSSFTFRVIIGKYILNCHFDYCFLVASVILFLSPSLPCGLIVFFGVMFRCFFFFFCFCVFHISFFFVITVHFIYVIVSFKLTVT